jgi:predicted RNA-binding Zn-ribbon protein involved in translation (DUF1610 family)
VESAVEGITVYAPLAPGDEAYGGPETFDCPQCGANTSWRAAVGGTQCDFCGFVQRSEAEAVGYAAKAGEFTLEALRIGDQGWGVDRSEIECGSCGAAFTVAAGAMAATCPFCGSHQVHVRQQATAGHRPGHLIPFGVEGEAATASARAWLGKGWVHPAGLREMSKIAQFTGVYVPFWVFDCRIQGSWRCEVGHHRTRRRSDGTTESYTVWEWKQGPIDIPWVGKLVPGTSHLSSIVLGRVEPFPLEQLVEYRSEFLAGWSAQAYDVTLPDAWVTGRRELLEQSKEWCKATAGGDTQRNFSAKLDLDDETWKHVLLPVHVSAYKFRGETFQVMVNGVTGEVGGQKPVAWWKIWPLIVLMQLPGMFFALLGLVLLLAGPAALAGFIPAVVCAFLGFVGGRQLYRWAADKERA